MSRFIVDMEVQLVWHGQNVAHFKGRDDLWQYLTKSKDVPERTVVKPNINPALVETVEEALKRGLTIKKIGSGVVTKGEPKIDLSGLSSESLLAKLGLV